MPAPGNPDALFLMANAERALGRWNEAVGHLQQAERLDPRRSPVKSVLGHILVYLRRYSEAREVSPSTGPFNNTSIESRNTIGSFGEKQTRFRRHRAER